MSENPYAPPKSPLNDLPPPAGSPVKAVLVGLAIDLGGSLLVGIVLGFFYAVSLASQGMRQEEVAQAMANIPPDSWLNVVNILVGSFLSFLGGFACARIARRPDYRLGFVLAAISSLSGLALSWEMHSATQNALFTLCTVACVLLGTKFGRVANTA